MAIGADQSWEFARSSERARSRQFAAASMAAFGAVAVAPSARSAAKPRTNYCPHENENAICFIISCCEVPHDSPGRVRYRMQCRDRPREIQFGAHRDGTDRFRLENLHRIRLRIVARARRQKLLAPPQTFISIRCLCPAAEDPVARDRTSPGTANERSSGRSLHRRTPDQIERFQIHGADPRREKEAIYSQSVQS